MLGPGRPAKRPSIDAVRELTREEVASQPRAQVPVVLRLRDTHHMVARLFASGLRPWQVAEKTGYSLARVSTLSGDPAFKELVASYRDSVNEEWRQSVDEYFESAIAVRTTSLRLIRDKLEEAEPGDIPLNQLVAIHADTADRTGYPKRKESINLNIDFAERLDRAVKRSSQAKVIEHSSPELGHPVAAQAQALAGGSSPDGARQAAQSEGLDASRAAPLSHLRSKEARPPELERKIERRFG